MHQHMCLNRQDKQNPNQIVSFFIALKFETVRGASAPQADVDVPTNHSLPPSFFLF